MWIIGVWFGIALLAAIVFGSMVRRGDNPIEHEITTRVAAGEHKRAGQ